MGRGASDTGRLTGSSKGGFSQICVTRETDLEKRGLEGYLPSFNVIYGVLRWRNVSGRDCD